MRLAIALLVLAVAAGCKKEETASPTPTPAGAQPGAAAQAADGALRGKIAERLDAANYTYLRLTTAQGDTWAAVPANTLAVGTDVVVTSPMPMQNFESKTLGRTFPTIMFGASAEPADGAAAQPGAQAAAAPPPGHAPGTDMGAPRPAAELGNVKTEKAAGADGRTVAEVWAQKDALKDKPVAIRGKVVKVTAGVLGKTWIHLRDGSGSDATKDNDVTITSDETPQLNEDVTLRGVVHVDRDLGSGYAYPVLIEDAKIVR